MYKKNLRRVVLIVVAICVGGLISSCVARPLSYVNKKRVYTNSFSYEVDTSWKKEKISEYDWTGLKFEFVTYEVEKDGLLLSIAVCTGDMEESFLTLEEQKAYFDIEFNQDNIVDAYAKDGRYFVRTKEINETDGYKSVCGGLDFFSNENTFSYINYYVGSYSEKDSVSKKTFNQLVATGEQVMDSVTINEK